MRTVLIALSAGLLFGAGLAVSGMADPARVQAFLDLFGHWDPTLAFVMGGAMLPMIVAWAWRRRLEKPFAEARFDLPATSKVDRNLVLGAVLFGAGWGVGGLCPGPALADLAIAPVQAGIFVLAMIGGMTAHRLTTS
ncbi:MAG: DUF6691 family protein [Parvularculaceae bacterium]